MRLPNYTSLSEEQDSIYLDAPMDGTVLVTGPPGTGKTVIAFYRAKIIAERNEHDVTVTMYNKVLKQYTKNASNNLFKVETLYSWLRHWWNRLGCPCPQDMVKRYNLYCSPNESDAAVKAGATWDKQNKTWWVSGDVYRKTPGLFLKWNPKGQDDCSLPFVGGDRYEIDWDKMLDVILHSVKSGSINPARVQWGHLLIDEAQDFAEGMYEFLYFLKKLIFSKSSIGVKKTSLTIFADENQRLYRKHNSSIAQIKKALDIPDKDDYKLTRNYRNTRPVAQLAAFFFTGLKTGIPKLPEKTGDLPVLVACTSVGKGVNYIYTFAKNNSQYEIGIFVKNDSLREEYYDKLSEKCKKEPLLKVQTYSSSNSPNEVNHLMFDSEAVISVLNKQSCKGLEFDAVFIPELQAYSLSSDDKDQFMMDMYVMISRARSRVFLMYTNAGDRSPGILKYLPGEDSKLMELKNES